MSTAALPCRPVEPVGQAITRLHSQGLSDTAISESLRSLGHGRSWTRRKVGYWRAHVLGLPRQPRTRRVGEFRSLQHARRARWRRYMVEARLGHLLPQRVRGSKVVRPGLLLRPRDVDVVVALRVAGQPLTSTELAERMGLASRRSFLADGRLGNSHRLTLLCLVGVLRLVPGQPCRYEPDPRTRDDRHRAPTRPDRIH